MASVPKIVDRAWAWVVASRSPIADRRFCIVPMKSTLPSSVVAMLKPYCSIAFAASVVGSINLDRPERRAVPAWLALMPALPIKPVAIAQSSTVMPRVPHTAPAYLNVSPIMATLVFALLPAATKTSAKCAESDAASPKAVRPSVSMSEVAARSSPLAAAAFITPAIPSSISSVDQPAMAMYSIADAASEAENAVVLPISRAFSRRASKSSPVAPDIDCTVDISASKSAVVFTAAAPMPTTAPVTTMSFWPTLSMTWVALSAFFVHSSQAASFSSLLVFFSSPCNSTRACSLLLVATVCFDSLSSVLLTWAAASFSSLVSWASSSFSAFVSSLFSPVAAVDCSMAAFVAWILD